MLPFQFVNAGKSDSIEIALQFDAVRLVVPLLPHTLLTRSKAKLLLLNPGSDADNCNDTGGNDGP